MATKKTAKKAPAKAAAPSNPNPPLGPNNSRRDDQAVIGHFAEVVSGDHKGRYGTVEVVSTVDADGEPESVVFRTRDDSAERLTVAYKDLRPAESGRR